MKAYLSNLPLIIASTLAISCGKPSALEQHLRKGEDVTEFFSNGYTALHTVDKKNNKVLGSFLSGNDKYIVFQDLNNNGKLDLQDYCSVNQFQDCNNSPAWAVPQMNNPQHCVVNICSTHYPHTLSSMNPSRVHPADGELHWYTTEEMQDINKIAPQTTQQIQQCPALCAQYFFGSKYLLSDIQFAFFKEID